MINKIIDEFCLMFSRPKEWHRVLFVVPLAALMSHGIYTNGKVHAGVPIESDTIIWLVLGSIVYAGAWAYIMLSGKLDFKLILRFSLCLMMSTGAHRLFVEIEKFGTWYLTILSLACILFVMIFIVTGKTSAINDVNVWFSVNFNEKKDTQAISHIPSVDDDRPSAGLG